MPRLKFIFILFFLHLLSTVNAQVLKIRDVISNQPLEFVTVYSPSLQIHISSNQKGQADISSLAGVDSIVIKLLGYKTENYSFSKLETKIIYNHLNYLSRKLWYQLLAGIRKKRIFLLK